MNIDRRIKNIYSLDFVKYGLAVGIPSSINLISFFIYTRALSPKEYADFTLILNIVGLIHLIEFQWLQMIIARMKSSTNLDSHRFSGIILFLFSGLALITFTGMFAARSIVIAQNLSSAMLIIAPLAILNSWVMINAAIENAKINISRYGRILLLRSVSIFLISLFFLSTEHRAYATLIGTFCGLLLTSAIYCLKPWLKIKFIKPNKVELKEYITYGLPFTGVFALSWIISYSDRFLINYYLDGRHTGIYCATYDLISQSIGVVIGLVNTAIYPRLMNIANNQGMDAAVRQLKQNGKLITSCSMTLCAIFIGVGETLIPALFGSEFHDKENNIIVILAISATLLSIKSFHLDITFQLFLKSKWQLVITLFTTIAHLTLCIILVPIYSLNGAAFTALTSALLSLFLSLFIGRRFIPDGGFLKAVTSGALVACVAYICTSTPSHFIQSPIGGIIIGAMLGMFGALITYKLLNSAVDTSDSISPVSEK